MSNIQETIGGDIYANAFYGSGTGLTGIIRSGLSPGTPNAIVVNNGAGVMTDTPTISPAQGGTGIDSSALTGIATVTAGVWSVGANITNTDISPTAAIDRTKLASGTANHVIINNPSGVMSSEAQLAVSRGGTGQNFSAVVGPVVPTISGGVWSATLGYSASSLASTLALRDGSANLQMNNAVVGGQLQSNVIVPYSGTTITTGSGATQLVLSLDKQQFYVAANAAADTAVREAITPDAVPVVVYSYTTAADTAYTVLVNAAARRTDTGNVASFNSKTRAKNVGGVVTLNNYDITRSREAGLTTCTAQPVASGGLINVTVTGTAATIRWTVEVTVIYHG